MEWRRGLVDNADISEEAREWWRRHFDHNQRIGPSVMLAVEYRDEKGSFGGAFHFTVPLTEWRADFADAVMRVAFADLAQHLDAEHPEKAAEIRRSLHPTV